MVCAGCRWQRGVGWGGKKGARWLVGWGGTTCMYVQESMSVLDMEEGLIGGWEDQEGLWKAGSGGREEWLAGWLNDKGYKTMWVTRACRGRCCRYLGGKQAWVGACWEVGIIGWVTGRGEVTRHWDITGRSFWWALPDNCRDLAEEEHTCSSWAGMHFGNSSGKEGRSSRQPI